MADFCFHELLLQEWIPTVGCTEPASVAYASAIAASLGEQADPITSVVFTCDSRMYKNCYAVGIPHSGGKTGLLWAIAIGSSLPQEAAPKRLECFGLTNDRTLAAAAELLKSNAIQVEINYECPHLLADCCIHRQHSTARCVIKHKHTAVALVELNGKALLDHPLLSAVKEETAHGEGGIIAKLVSLGLPELFEIARNITTESRELLRHGAQINRKICQTGIESFKEPIERSSSQLFASDPYSQASKLVFHGVHARMCGTNSQVFCLAGSGNKGITISVPIIEIGAHLGLPQERIDEALAMACMVTCLTTSHLGTLSAICGCNNAAGIGLAAGLVMMNNGSAKELSLAINNMVGNVAGMICDGAKMGCALKALSAVDAAFRAVNLAMHGVGIPASDGIVGSTGKISLQNLGKVAIEGMRNMDRQILDIMQEKLRSGATHAEECPLHHR
eukprot:TRINITY_DN3774_c0_g1_i1.p1 TRINITY_DN3774_c0_g1~~TRINITY_DN3774_c0_g1_i1.p1  ORF type:complete len:448 (-),score=127.87 TRINITY_DN3774_c0_g1_i1:121-1464(-)